jgi:hypothetical protein
MKGEPNQPPAANSRFVNERRYGCPGVAAVADAQRSAAPVTKHVIICAFLASMSGCLPKYRESPWAGCVRSSGNTYVMLGTETIKTATLMTADGTFKEFSFPIRRTFHLLEKGTPYKDLGRFEHKGDNLSRSVYQFFSQSNAMIALDDSDPGRIQHLTLRKTFCVPGLLIDFDLNRSRFCLVEDHKSKRISKVDKLTGQSTPLTAASLNFLGNLWNVNVFIDDDGRRITRAQTDYARDTTTISAWDAQREALLLTPRTISFSGEHPRIRLCDIQSNAVFLVVAGSHDGELAIKAIKLGPLGVRQNLLAKPSGRLSAMIASRDDPHTFSLLFRDLAESSGVRQRWVLNRHDIDSGDCTYTDSFDIPLDPQNPEPTQPNKGPN